MLFSEPKIPQSSARLPQPQSRSVSVLFSEPKIPQWLRRDVDRILDTAFQCSSASRKFLNSVCGWRCRLVHARFSALQRAENSSIEWRADVRRVAHEFQCSSASRKFLNTPASLSAVLGSSRFSALQRAENSSMSTPRLKKRLRSTFQCSSASRKFLNT